MPVPPFQAARGIDTSTKIANTDAYEIYGYIRPWRENLQLHKILLSIRPASLGSWLAGISGLNRRRVVSIADGQFYVNPISNFGSRVMSRESYEPATRRAIEQNLKEGDTFIDLGANEGYFSILASRLVGPRGRVVTIEPQERLQAVIRRNCELNGSTNVTVLQAVVGAADGSVELELTPDVNTGASGLYRQTKYTLPTQTVRSMTLGTMLREAKVSRCDLIKIDIEGAEYDLVMEAKDVLRSGAIRCMVMEIHDSIIASRGLKVEDLRSVLTECGYGAEVTSEVAVFRFEKEVLAAKE